MRNFIILIIVGGLFFSSGFVQAGNRDGGVFQQVAENVFSSTESMRIRDYYARYPVRDRDDIEREWEDDDDSGKKKHKHKNKNKNKGKGGKGKKKGLPPGLAKKDSLPPGLAKQLERNGTLPPGLAKRDLPYDLERQLPVLDDRYARVIVDQDVVLVNRATGVILDILRNVTR
ncbi:MAG: hypothetical protein U9R66_12325 [Thermodesulfobacteriota bacterium]|nr:hypothetical protein [Thermodesulfobacteriota bacterium]